MNQAFQGLCIIKLVISMELQLYLAHCLITTKDSKNTLFRGLALSPSSGENWENKTELRALDNATNTESGQFN
jgi:hypothetical protein